MSIRLPIAAAALLALAPTLAAAQPQTFEKTLTVGAAPSLEVTSDSGDISVGAGSGSSIIIKGTVTVRTGWGAVDTSDASAPRRPRTLPRAQGRQARRRSHLRAALTHARVSDRHGVR